jgi:hypothetical protein
MNIRQMLRSLGVDIGAPVLAYYVLHLLGASDWVALPASTLVAALRIGWVAVRSRSLNLFATVMLVVFGLGLALSFLSGDPRFLLLKDSIVTGAVGLTFLGTALVGNRPLALAARQGWSPAEADALAADYRSDPYVRRGYRFTSAVWGAGLLVEAAVRVPLVYLLPVDVMVGLSTAIQVVAFVGLGAWTVRWAARAKARAVAGHGVAA